MKIIYKALFIFNNHYYKIEFDFDIEMLYFKNLKKIHIFLLFFNLNI